jgi:hypothetical protein
MVLVGNDIAIDAGGGDDVVSVRGRGNRAQGGGGNDVLIAGGGALSAAVRARVDALVGAATAALGIGGANGASLDAILAAVGLDGLIGIARGLVEEARAALDGSREAQQMFAELLGEKLAAAAEESRSTAGEDAIARGEQRVNAPPGLPETTNGTTQSQQGIASANGAIGRAFGQAALPTVNFGELTSGQPATVQQARAGGEQMQADAIARKNEANREVNRAQGELNAQQDPVIDNFNFGEAVTGYNSELAQGRAQIANATSGSAIPGTLSPSVGNNEYATLAGRAGGAGGLNLSLGSGPVNNGDGLADGGWWNDGLPEDFALAPEAPDAPSAPTPDVSGANAQIGQAQAGGSNWQSSAASGASAGEDPLGIGSTIYAQAGEALTNRLRKNSQLGRLNSSDDLRTTGTQGSNLGQTQGMAGLGEGRELVGEGRGLLGELRDSSEGGGALEAGSPGIEAMVRERFATLTLDAVLGELRAKAGQVTEAAGQFLGASEADWSAVRGFLAEVSAGASSGEAARLEGGAGDDLLLGGAGGDDLAGDSGGDLLWGRGGDDRLSGGADADTYLFGRGDGSDVIATGDDNLDELRFGEAVSEFQVWLRQSGDDLQVRVGTWSGDTFRSVDQATVVGWYGGDEDAGGRPALPGFGIDGGASASGGASGGDAPLAQLRTDAGAVLLATQVQQLVDYMAGFTPDAAGSVNLTAEQHQQLDATISAAWQTA